jgi:5-formyltetrahydrofolate cyclo-ligase
LADDVRARLLAWRRALPRSEVAERSRRVAAHIVAWSAFQRAGCVLAYLATPSEVQTAAIIAAAAGKRVCVPAVVGGDLILRPLVPGVPLVRGALGIPEPASGMVPPGEVDLALVPGVAFDPAGHRMGRGGGYYDRLLPRLHDAVTCGLAFREQVVAVIEPAAWDAGVAHLCTEDGIVPSSPPAAR